MGVYDPIPVASPLVGIAKDLRRRQRREADTTAGQLHNTATRTKEQFDFLLRQTGSATVAGVSGPVDVVGGDTDVHWLDFDAENDAQVSVVTSSTGEVAISWGALIEIRGIGMANSKIMAGGYVAMQIISDGDVVHEISRDEAAQTYQETYRMAVARGKFSSTLRVALRPNEVYDFRTRRGYQAWSSNDAAVSVRFGPGAFIAVDKIGV